MKIFASNQQLKVKLMKQARIIIAIVFVVWLGKCAYYCKLYCGTIRALPKAFIPKFNFKEL